MDFREVSEQAFIDAPVEVVVEWNVELNLPAGFPADP